MTALPQPSQLFPGGASLAALALAFILPAAAQAQGIPTTLHLPTGSSLTGTVNGVEADGIRWQGEGAENSIKMAFSNFVWAEFEQPEDWIAAEEVFAEGNYTEAIRHFSAIAGDKTARRGYPARGNFATLAHRRILECHRGLGDPYYVGFLNDSLEADKLAPHEAIDPIMECWALAGKKVADPAIARINEVIRSLPRASPDYLELHWLLGYIHQADDDPSSALNAYCRAYTLNAGADHHLAPRALRDAILLLSEQPGRGAEAQSMMRIYRTTYGRGELWEDIPEEVAALMDQSFERGKINFFGSGEDDTAPTPEPTGVSIKMAADRPDSGSPGSPGSEEIGVEPVATLEIAEKPGGGMSITGGRLTFHEQHGDVHFASGSDTEVIQFVLDQNYEPGFRYRCSVQTYGTAKAAGTAMVAFGTGSGKEYRRFASAVYPNQLDGAAWMEGIKDTVGTFNVPPGSPAAGEPITIRLGTSELITRFREPIQITRQPTGLR